MTTVQFRQKWQGHQNVWEAFVCPSPEIGCVVGHASTRYGAVHDLLFQLEKMEREIKAAVDAALEARSKE
jgi:hypothetical protein